VRSSPVVARGASPAWSTKWSVARGRSDLQELALPFNKWIGLHLTSIVTKIKYMVRWKWVKNMNHPCKSVYK
jgi:hypothetical protein